MSAPQTNLEKQERRHWGPIAGISLALVAAAFYAVFFLAADEVENDAVEPDGAVQAEGGDAAVDHMNAEDEVQAETEGDARVTLGADTGTGDAEVAED